MVKHYLLTNINAGLYKERAKTEVFYVEDREAWFAQRYELLKKYCIPAVEAQTCRDFIWVWRIDPNTPADHYALLDELRMLHPCIVMVPQYKYAIKQTTDIVITTRMDSDDIISKSYIAAIQNAAKRCTTPHVINFPYGIYYDVRTKTGSLVRKKHVNQFASLVETGTRSFAGVYCCQHTQLGKTFPVLNVETESPRWVWMIHDQQASQKYPERFTGLKYHTLTAEDLKCFDSRTRRILR